MKEQDIKQQFQLLQKQIEVSAALTEETQLALLAALDSVRVEIEVLRRFIERCHPDFMHRYAALKQEVIVEINPECAE